MNQELEYHIYRRFDVLERCGSGTYGVVYKVLERKTGAVCALKKICDAFQNRTDSQRTYREALYLSEIRHQYVVKLLDIIEAKNNRDLYLLFEFVEFDVANILGCCQLEPIQRKHIAFQLLEAVNCLHSMGIIHRDIKPSNILINRQCDIKLCDFGLSRSVFTMSQHDNQIMTQYVAARWYRPPQVILSTQTYDFSVDMWAVGCFMAELVLRKPLFNGNSILDQLQKIISIIGMPKKTELETLQSHEALQLLNNFTYVKRTPLSEILLNVDDQELDLMMKLLQFSPTNRISSKNALQHPYFSQFYEAQTVSVSRSTRIKEHHPEDNDYKRLVHELALNYKDNEKTSNYTVHQEIKRKSDTIGQASNSTYNTRSSNNVNNSTFMKSTTSHDVLDFIKPNKSRSGMSFKGKSKTKVEMRRPSKTKYEKHERNSLLKSVKTVSILKDKDHLRVRQPMMKRPQKMTSQKLVKARSALNCSNSLLVK